MKSLEEKHLAFQTGKRSRSLHYNFFVELHKKAKSYSSLVGIYLTI